MTHARSAYPDKPVRLMLAENYVNDWAPTIKAADVKN